MCFCYSKEKQPWRTGALTAFHMQAWVLLQKEGPSRPRPEPPNKGCAVARLALRTRPWLQSGWRGRPALLGSLIAAEKENKLPFCHWSPGLEPRAARGVEEKVLEGH